MLRNRLVKRAPQTVPIVAAINEPRSTPSLAALRSLSSLKASMAMKIDMVKPMPASRPTGMLDEHPERGAGARLRAGPGCGELPDRQCGLGREHDTSGLVHERPGARTCRLWPSSKPTSSSLRNTDPGEGGSANERNSSTAPAIPLR